MRKLFLWLLFGGLVFGLSSAQTTNSPVSAPDASVVQLGHGVNLGNFLENAHDEAEVVGPLREDYFSTIRQAGFTFVRVPIRWCAHVSALPPYTIDPAFLGRIDWVVAQAKKNNLQAIIDYHHDPALMDNPDANAERYLATWMQIAQHYKDEPPSVLFELLNEPNTKMNAAHWNALLVRALNIVRVNNPTRTVVIGPVLWNGIGTLGNFVLPDSDRNILVTVHYYDPLKFTHQGASWHPGADKWLGTTWMGTDAEKLAVTKAFDKAAAWGIAHHRPMFLGEFGALDKGAMDSRARWTAFVARTAESHGFSWAYWEFCSGFGVYDPVANQWRKPLLDALLPK